VACALCLEESPLRDSHIIPNAYFRHMKRQKAGRLITFDDSSSTPVRYSNESWYEPLLCASCEQRLSKWETSCIDSLRRTGRLFEHSGIGGASAHKFNHRTFHDFLLSVLWKAAIARHPAFSRVVLPPAVLEEFRLCLHKDMPTHQAHFDCRIRKLVDGQRHFAIRALESFLTSPTVKITSTGGAFMFIFGGYVIDYFVPRAPFRQRQALGFVKRQAPLFIPSVDFSDIPELMAGLVAGYAKAARGLTELGI